MKKKHIVLKIFLVIVIVLAGAFGIYVQDYYHADETAQAALKSNDIKVRELADGTYTFFPEEKTDTGLIFYPGGKVEYTAYAPLMKEYAENGTACILLKMPFNLAVFDINAADGMEEKYPDIHHWYIGGHSLGGAMASVYASKHLEDFEGEILLGAYNTEDISSSDLKVYLLHGSEDHVLNMDQYEKNRSNNPAGSVEYVIQGGNHSQFGSYGHQKGDGDAFISPEEQWEETVQNTLAGREEQMQK